MQRSKLKEPSLRNRIMASVGALIVISLLASTISLFRITEVNRLLGVINRVSVPLGRLFTQIQSDADILKRELDRGLGYSHWKDPHWRARPIPKWIQDVLENEVERASTLIKDRSDWSDWTTPEAREQWSQWADSISHGLKELENQGQKLDEALEKNDQSSAAEIYPKWVVAEEEWQRELQWGAAEYDHMLRQTFSLAENRVSQLRIGLESVLVVVVALSLLVLWFGERALRPLNELTNLAQQITRRGLRREDKDILREVSPGTARKDEVSALAREFHSMATALLEREKMVETQKNKLEEQNRLLREMNDLQERVRRAENLAAVGRLSAQVAHEVRNPLHAIGLEAEIAAELATKTSNPGLKQSLQSILIAVDRLEKITENYLKLSKLSAGEKKHADLGEILESTLATYAPSIEAQQVKMDWKREQGSNLTVYVDRDLMEQVLGNLLRNSLQALERTKDPEIRWSLGNTESGKVWLRIEDNGPGISPQVKSRLFTPFITTRAQGTGLGLSFVKKVLEDQGGSIRCLDRPPLQGASFEMILPQYLEATLSRTMEQESHV